MDNEYKIIDDSAVGSLRISDDVICTIARIAAMEVSGVEDVAFPQGSVRGFLNRSAIMNPIKVDVEENDVSIEISIIVRVGSTIPELAAAVQENIKSAVETSAGLNVTRVDVRVAGIAEEKAKTEETAAADDEA